MNRSNNKPESLQEHARLPEPDTDAHEHIRRVCDHIHGVIADEGGSISFARYMELALYAPGLGYYSAGARKFGAAGDFITAPELSPLFSRCLARQCRQVLDTLEGGCILELGAGSGIMACDVLLELERLNCLPSQYLILEVSGELRERQKATIQQHIAHLSSRVSWLDTLPENEIEGIILANEVLDAFPVHRFVLSDSVIKEQHVISEKGGFNWKLMPAGPELENGINEILEPLSFTLAEGYTSEINLKLKPWMQSLASTLSRGVMILIDYGYPAREYYHPHRIDGTLLCHYRHRVHDDPFVYPGMQDITASVNFTQLAEAAVDTGLSVSGYTTQAYFLFACELEEVVGDFSEMDTREQLELSRQVKILTLPGEMGERFKVMALSRKMDLPFKGFELVDHRGHL